MSGQAARGPGRLSRRLPVPGAAPTLARTAPSAPCERPTPARAAGPPRAPPGAPAPAAPARPAPPPAGKPSCPAMLVEFGVAGPGAEAGVLAWRIHEDDRPLYIESALVAAQDGDRWVLAHPPPPPPRAAGRRAGSCTASPTSRTSPTARTPRRPPRPRRRRSCATRGGTRGTTTSSGSAGPTARAGGSRRRRPFRGRALPWRARPTPAVFARKPIHRAPPTCGRRSRTPASSRCPGAGR